MYRQSEEEGDLPYAGVMRWLAAGAGIFAIILLVDYIMPVSCGDYAVTEKVFFKESTRFGSTSYDLRVITEDFKFKAKPELFAAIEENSIINVCRTPVFKAVREVSGISEIDKEPFKIEAILPVYRGLCAFPISLLIASAFGVFFKRDDTVAYGAGIIAIVLLTTILMIL